MGRMSSTGNKQPGKSMPKSHSHPALLKAAKLVQLPPMGAHPSNKLQVPDRRLPTLLTLECEYSTDRAFGWSSLMIRITLYGCHARIWCSKVTRRGNPLGRYAAIMFGGLPTISHG
jgi:hypothetical protein